MLNNDLNCSAGPEAKYPLIKVPNPLAGQDGTVPTMRVYRSMYPGHFEALNAALETTYCNHLCHAVQIHHQQQKAKEEKTK